MTDTSTDSNTTLLYISRNSQICDHLISLHPGRVYRSCPYKEFKHNYQTIECIFTDSDAFYSDWVDWEHIKGRWQEIPIVIIRETVTNDCAKKVLEDGAWECVKLPDTKEDLRIILTKLSFYKGYVLNQKELLSSLIVSEQESTQKTTIMQTMLDILSHDTRNVFLKLQSLIVQLPRSETRSEILDTYEELYNGTQEALGYLRESKRVYSLTELVNSLRLSQDRIELEHHPRIIMKSDSRYLMFVEVSALFKNVLMNIIENALKYSPRGEKVTVRLKKNKGSHEIAIADRGPGIADPFKKKIFNRYFRVNETDGKGSGRGLWISKNILEKDGGSILVEDNPSGGTVFRITVPMYKSKDRNASLREFSQWFQVPLSDIENKASAISVLLEMESFNIPENEIDSIVVANVLDQLRREKNVRGSKDIKIKLEEIKQLNPEGPQAIVADDSVHVHHYLGQYLTELGYHIQNFAKNGNEAIEYLTTLGSDLITLDCTMPGKSGIEVAKEISARNIAVKILFITALGEHPDFINHLKKDLHSVEYRIITKPFSKEQLIDALNSLGLPTS